MEEYEEREKEQANPVYIHTEIFACWGAGRRWRPLPQAEAPTEATDETIPNPLNLKKEQVNGKPKKKKSNPLLRDR